MADGILNVVKPPGMTSHDVVSFLRRLFGTKRVGHAGTLDPAAAGVLPVFLGQATRLIEYATDADKGYRVELTFGYATDTGDDTGRIIRELDCDIPSRQRLEEVLATFVGSIEQVPPMYSAIKIGGKKLYELAREGITVERKARSVTISSINLLDVQGKTILFDVSCSKGTYIRSLCEDIGEKFSCPAVMTFLVRTRVGAFSLPDAHTLEEISLNQARHLLPLDIAIDHIPSVTLTANQARALQQGRSITFPVLGSRVIRLYNSERHLIGIGQESPEQGILKPVKILSPFAK